MIIELLNALQVGLIYSLVSIAVYLTFRVIDFADLTVDGSFMLVSAITGSLIVSGVNPILASFISLIGGMTCGIITAYLNVKWNILSLLCGILVMIFLYSVNLRIMGKPNIVLMDESTLFSGFTNPLIPLIFIIMSILMMMIFLLTSNYGLGIRAAGINKEMSKAYGINVNVVTFVVLAISNGLIALSGSIFTQIYGFSDISMGVGVITIGLANKVKQIVAGRDNKIPNFIPQFNVALYDFVSDLL